MAILTLQLVRILERPISDDDINEALRPYYPDSVLCSGHEANGLILAVKNGNPIPLGYRNVDGPWVPPNKLGLSTAQSDYFLGVVSSQVETLRKALPGRLQPMCREFQINEQPRPKGTGYQWHMNRVVN